MLVSVSTMTAASRTLGTPASTATMELTEFEWKVIITALSEAQTLPSTSRQLGDEIAEHLAVQFN
jgi:hypothetical protein